MRELNEETHYRVEAFVDGDWQYVGCTQCLWNANKKARYYRNQHDAMTRVVRVSVVYKPEVYERVVARIHTTAHNADDHKRANDLRELLTSIVALDAIPMDWGVVTPLGVREGER